MTTTIRFKGGPLLNRYKITGALATIAPLHIGDGGRKTNPARFPAVKTEDGKEQEAFQFSTVATDASGLAHVPGSTMKGNLRAWLSQIFSAPLFTQTPLASINDAERAKALNKAWKNLRDEARTHDAPKLVNMVELLFGSAINEGKLEFWDAPMATPPKLPNGQSPLAYCGYDPCRGTIVLKSTAIDPVSRTAAAERLFNFEVVPQGALFHVTVTGQNLFAEELGMLLFALNGFNSQILPVTLGAKEGSGFGRCKFELEKIHVLDTADKAGFMKWLESALANGHAGYQGIDPLDDVKRTEAEKSFNDRFLPIIKAAAQSAVKEGSA